jgi:hypothetical protein
MRFDVDDPRHRAVLQAARSWGVSPSMFLGEPRSLRTINTDGTTTTTTVAPEWTEADRDAAMALVEWEAGLCPSCAHPLAETAAAENEYAYEAAGPPIRCHRCTAADVAMKPHEDKPATHALFIPMRLKEKGNQA